MGLLSAAIFIKLFVIGFTVRAAVKFVRVHHYTVASFFLRLKIPYELGEEIEADESYFRGRTKVGEARELQAKWTTSIC